MTLAANLTSTSVERAEELPADARGALRDLILTLADNKRLLGIRYADWMLGAPSLETGIAASSMAQDEWGHSRLTCALLSDFGEDPKQLEHERPAEEYHSMEALDTPFASWTEMLAAALLLDGALSVQYTALLQSRYTPVRNRVQKLLDEEAFHFQYAAGWARRLAGAPELRPAFTDALRRFLPVALRWLGRPDAPALHRMLEEGLVTADPDSLRTRFLARIGPVLAEAGLADAVGLVEHPDGWRTDREPGWDEWSDARRRAAGGGPDPDTLARVRGDRNRAMLLD